MAPPQRLSPGQFKGMMFIGLPRIAPDMAAAVIKDGQAGAIPGADIMTPGRCPAIANGAAELVAESRKERCQRRFVRGNCPPRRNRPTPPVWNP